MSDEKRPPNLEHQEPPIYYCWKYWTSDGEIREGCTPIEPKGHEGWPDLNDYGWVYVAVPIAIIFVLIFLIYLICSKTKSHSPQKQALPDESESEDEVPSPRSKWARVQSYQPRGEVHAVPVKKTNLGDLATVVHMAKQQNMQSPDRKVPPRSSVTSPMYTHGRVYPQLSRKSNGGHRADEEVTIDGKRIPHNPSMNGPSAPPLSHYVNSASRKGRPNEPLINEEIHSSDDDLSHSEEENE